MSQVGLLTAFLAGVLSLLSPCSALLLPSFFAYAFATRTQQLARTGVFLVGLMVTLVPLGVGASAVSQVLYGHRTQVVTVAGWSLVALGLLLALGRGFALPGAARLHAAAARRTGSGTPSAGGGWLSTLALGAVYGLGGFCSGPILGAVLTVAATQTAPWSGATLLAAYACGMATPLFVLAALWDRFDLGHRAWLRGHPVRLGPVRTHTTSLVSGLLFVLVGVVFLAFDGTAEITSWLGLADAEYAAQQWLARTRLSVPLWVWPLLLSVVLGWVAWRRSRENPSR